MRLIVLILSVGMFSAIAYADATTRPEDDAVRQALDLPRPSVDYKGYSFRDVIGNIGDTSEANIFVDYVDLAGTLNPDAPIQLQAKDLPLSAVLQQVLDQASGGKASYEIDRGIIMVEPADALRVTEQIQDAEEGSILQDEKTYGQLNRVLAAASFPKVPISQALNFMKDMTAADIQPHWDELSDAGIQQQTQVSLGQMRKIPVSTLLDLTLRAAGGNKAMYGLEGGHVVVSSVDHFKSTTTTQTYDVADLIGTTKKLDDIKQQLQNAVPWGAGTNIAESGDHQLVVTQSEFNQFLMGKFFGDLRLAWTPMVSIQLRFFTLPADSDLAKDWQRRLADNNQASLSDAELNDWMRMATRSSMASVVHAPRITNRSGLSATMEATTSTPYVADVRTRQISGVDVSTPIMETALDGSRTTAKGTVESDNSVHLEMTIEQSKFAGFADAPAKSSPTDNAQLPAGTHIRATEDLTVAENQTVVTALPESDGPMLSGGSGKDWKVTTDFAATQPSASDDAVFLFVTPRIIRPGETPTRNP